MREGRLASGTTFVTAQGSSFGGPPRGAAFAINRLPAGAAQARQLDSHAR